MRSQRGEIVGVVVHVVAAAHLRRAAVTAPVMGDDAIATITKNIICASHSSADSGQPWLKTMGWPVPQSLK